MIELTIKSSPILLIALANSTGRRAAAETIDNNTVARRVSTIEAGG
jgi:hypothetical protein